MNRVKELCIRKGIEQKELSLLVGVSQPTVSDWFNQKKNPSGSRLEKLSEVLDVSRAYILGYDEEQAQSAVTFTGTLKPEDIVYNSPLDMAAVNRNLNQSKSAVELQNEEREIAQGVIARLRRLTPERQKQALEYLDFLEQQEGK